LERYDLLLFRVGSLVVIGELEIRRKVLLVLQRERAECRNEFAIEGDIEMVYFTSVEISTSGNSQSNEGILHFSFGAQEESA
jgi:hypothetical protein